jgi:formylglycine-generating enzyme required for sulfatase activity
MPVHGIDWIDAIVWCNAYWELLGEIENKPRIDPYGNPSGYPYLKSSNPIKDVRNWTVVTDPSEITFNPSTTAFRLPTETEWEFAARGGEPANPPWNYAYAGGSRVDDVAWLVTNSGLKAHASNETKTPLMIATASLYNMSGNVWEWCMTDDAASNPFDVDGKLNAATSLMFLKRGGAYNADSSLSSNNKGRLDKVSKDMDQNTGFRLLRSR